MTSVSQMFSEAILPEAIVHGVLVEVYDVGVLIIGDSASGKSQCALDLMKRGHKLISDDSVQINKIGAFLHGKPPENIRDLIEIRGVGIVNARDLYGASALAESADIGICIELLKLSSAADDSSNLEHVDFTILETTIPRLLLNAASGQNLATSVEAAAVAFSTRANFSIRMELLSSNHREVFACGHSN